MFKIKNIGKIVATFICVISTAIGAEKPLVIGMELAYPPFEMTDARGNPTGFSVDMAKDLGKYLNREIKIENMSYGGLIPALKTNKIDIILSSMTITQERLKSISFSIPYAKSYLSILVNKNSPVEKVADLNVKGRKIAVKKGTTGHLVSTEYFPNAEILVFDKETPAVLEVTQGKVDAFIYDPLTIIKNWKDNPNTTKPIFEQFQKESENWGIGYRQEDSQLGEQINAFIKNYKATGGFDKLSEKYLGEQKKAFDERGIPFFF
ncbi:MAG: transporter substrate-binding domain-containing protein [Fusobacteriaceae bacterium]